jgi:LysR family glycine cleavage system transcriptional activator
MSSEISRLTSLDLLRGFVAVGRRMSITLAAGDLYLTQSAVSRQIQALEAQLGVRLLQRGYRAIALTEEGEQLFRVADPLFRQLQGVLSEITATAGVKPVTLSTTIGFTVLWLMPRLSGFQRAHPGVDLRVSAHTPVMDLQDNGIDLAIRYCSARQAPAGAKRLFEESVVPVASPALGLRSLRSARALSSLTLLEFEVPQYRWLRWQPWLESNGWAASKPRAVLHFNQYDLAIQAALAGQGVALGRMPLVRGLIESGRLVTLPMPKCESCEEYGFWLVRAAGKSRAEVDQVASWIFSEAMQQQGEKIGE